MSRRSQSSSPHSQLGFEPRKMRGKVDDDRGLNVDLPEFNGIGDPNVFIDWLYEIERIFEYKGYDEVKRYKVAIRMFKGYASLWWDYIRKKRECQGKAKMQSWEKLKWYLKKRFLPDNHNQGLHTPIQNPHRPPPHYEYASLEQAAMRSRFCVTREKLRSFQEKWDSRDYSSKSEHKEKKGIEKRVEEANCEDVIVLDRVLHTQVNIQVEESVVENEIESQGVSCQKSPSGFNLVRDIEYPMDFIIGSSLPSKPTLAHHIERSKEFQGQGDDVRDIFVFNENEVCVPRTQRDCMVLQGTRIEDDDVLNLRTNSLQPGEYDPFRDHAFSAHILVLHGHAILGPNLLI